MQNIKKSDQTQVLIEAKLKEKFEAIDHQLPNWAGELKRDSTCFAYFYFKNKLKKRWRNRFYQDIILNDKSKRIVVCISRQMGKEQPFSANILTEYGWMEMGSLEVGDTIIGGDGKPTKVLKVFEQGEKEVYKITFTDGATAECGLEHLWKARKAGCKHWKVISLKDILKNNGNFPDSDLAYRIPSVEPVEFIEQKHIIDPYVLGALLGDGGLSQNGIKFTCHNDDKEIVDNINSLIPETDVLQKLKNYKFSYYFKRKKYNGKKPETEKELNKLGLMGCKTEYKFIPWEYSMDSPKNRIKLLQGLMDTDGSIHGKCRMEITTVSEVLRDDIKFLVQSLGGKFNYYTKMGKYKKDGKYIETQLNYRCIIRLQDINPFYLKRKADKFYNIKYSKDKIIKSIKYVRDEKSRCIMVDNKDQTYVTNDCVVTHNSTMAAIKAFHTAYYYPNKTVVIISNTKPQAIELIRRIKELMRSGTFDDFKSLLPTQRDSRSEIIIGHNNGKDESRIISVPATDAARGYTADLVIVDEGAFIENGDYIFTQVIEPMTQATKGDILLLSTPNGRVGYFYDAFVSKHWSSYQFDWKANPENTQEEMDRKKDTMTSLAFEAEYEAKFLTSQSAYFKHSEIHNSVSKLAGQGATPESSPLAVGVDFGKIHDKSVIFIGNIINPMDDSSKHIIRVLERREKPLGTEYSQVIAELKHIGKNLKPTIMVLDASGVGEVPAEILAKEDGLITEPIKFSIQKKMEIFSNLKILFQQGRIQIPGDKQMINELELFEYKYTDSGNMMLHAREGHHDDEVDALGLMAWGLTRAINPPVTIQII